MRDEPEKLVLNRLHEDVGDKQINIRPKPIKSLVNDLLARRGYAQKNAADRFVEIWRAAVGERLAASSRPGLMRKGVLNIIVENSVALQELTMRRQSILQYMGQEAPELKVAGLKFRIGVFR